jgi:hypothetical protein
MINASGGLNPYKDIRVDEVATKLYEQIRRRRTDIEYVARNTGFSIEQVTMIKNYIFYDSHVLVSGYSRFAPCYEMAQSWLRLSSRTGKNIKQHDALLLYHELWEIKLLLTHNNYSQSMAHAEAEDKFNYAYACKQYYSQF